MATALAARYAQAFSGPGAGLSFLTRGGCAPAPGVGFGIAGMDCVRWTAEAYRYAETSPYRRVVIVAAWPDILGDPALAALQDEVLVGLQLSDPPPADMPLPIVMRLSAQRPQ